MQFNNFKNKYLNKLFMYSRKDLKMITTFK